MVTVQVVPETASQPLQPLNMEPRSGLAVKVTTVPLTSEAEQVAPQSIPGGSEVTVPLPMPKPLALGTLEVKRVRLKLAVTVRAAIMVTVQVVLATALQPLPPLDTEWVPAVTVRATTVPPTAEPG